MVRRFRTRFYDADLPLRLPSGIVSRVSESCSVRAGSAILLVCDMATRRGTANRHE